jgi:hypothetical protein
MAIIPPSAAEFWAELLPTRLHLMKSSITVPRVNSHKKRLAKLKRAAEVLNAQLLPFPNFLTVAYWEVRMKLNVVFHGPPPPGIPSSFNGFPVEVLDANAIRCKGRDRLASEPG